MTWVVIARRRRRDDGLQGVGAGPARPARAAAARRRPSSRCSRRRCWPRSSSRRRSAATARSCSTSGSPGSSPEASRSGCARRSSSSCSSPASDRRPDSAVLGSVDHARSRRWSSGSGRAASAQIEVLGGGITNRNFKVTLDEGGLRAPDRRQGHGAARDRPPSRARGVARRGGRRRRTRGGRLRRARGLPRHPLHRGRGRRAGAMRRPRDAATCRAVASARSTRARRSRPASTPSASSRRTRRRPRRTGSTCRRAYERARETRRARRAGARPGAGAALPQRPAQRQLHRRRRPDPDRRLGVRGHGRRLLRPRQLLGQPRALDEAGRRAPARLLG